MIKVIEHGNHPYHRGTCTKCGCKVQCDPEDVMHDGDITGSPMYVICPECGERIMLLESYIPAGYGTATSFTSSAK